MCNDGFTALVRTNLVIQSCPLLLWLQFHVSPHGAALLLAVPRPGRLPHLLQSVRVQVEVPRLHRQPGERVRQLGRRLLLGCRAVSAVKCHPVLLLLCRLPPAGGGAGAGPGRGAAGGAHRADWARELDVGLVVPRLVLLVLIKVLLSANLVTQHKRKDDTNERKRYGKMQ